MRKKLFEELKESIRQMNRIRRGDLTGKVTTAADLGLAPSSSEAEQPAE